MRVGRYSRALRWPARLFRLFPLQDHRWLHQGLERSIPYVRVPDSPPSQSLRYEQYWRQSAGRWQDCVRRWHLLHQEGSAGRWQGAVGRVRSWWTISFFCRIMFLTRINDIMAWTQLGGPYIHVCSSQLSGVQDTWTPRSCCESRDFRKVFLRKVRKGSVLFLSHQSSLNKSGLGICFSSPHFYPIGNSFG